MKKLNVKIKLNLHFVIIFPLALMISHNYAWNSVSLAEDQGVQGVQDNQKNLCDLFSGEKKEIIARLLSPQFFYTTQNPELPGANTISTMGLSYSFSSMMENL